MHEVDKESHRRTTSGPLRYYEFVDEYNRIARFYETFAAMNYDKVSRILGNIDLIKMSSAKRKQNKDFLRNALLFTASNGRQRPLKSRKSTLKSRLY